MEQISLHWEEVKTNHGEYVYRARISGGWLYKVTCDTYIVDVNRDGEVRTEGYTSSICFVPDH